MTVFDDIKLQYKIGGVANRIIYWNVAAFLVSLIFFYQFKVGVFSYPKWIILSSNLNVLVYFPKFKFPKMNIEDIPKEDLSQ